jgi:hypothetical protein
MFKIILPADRFEPDMTAVASAFGISVTDVHDGIAIGTISRWFEVGTGDADDKPHQIFASALLGIRVDVDEHGNVQSIGKHEVASADLKSHDDTGCSNSAVQEPLATPLQYGPDTTRKTHMDALLDEALNESFPASDPIAISVPRPRARSDNE